MADAVVSGTDNKVSERRRHRRYVVPMYATAVRRSGEDGQCQVVSLYVKDISHGGLCCLVPRKIELKEELVLFIPPQGGRGGRDVRAQVTRCEQVEGQYQLGVAFNDPLSEAAQRIH